MSCVHSDLTTPQPLPLLVGSVGHHEVTDGMKWLLLHKSFKRWSIHL